MATFVESAHPRNRAPGAGAGQFVTKARDEPAVTLEAQPPAVDPYADDPHVAPGDLLDALYVQARKTMDEHGLHDWTLAYTSKLGSRLGSTHHARRLIVLSGPKMAAVDGAERLDTVLHEVAHALCGPHDGHGSRWQATALRLGADPTATVRLDQDVTVQTAAVVGTCPSGHTVTQGRMPSPRKRTLGYCGHRDHPRDQAPDERRFEWTRNVVDPQVAAAVARHPEPKATVTLKVGDTVTIDLPGHEYDGESGPVTRVGRTSVVVHLRDRGRLVRAPVESVRPA